MKHSYSSINCFKNCPAQFKAKYVDYTYKDTGNKQNRAGTIVHKSLEDNIKSNTPLPPELATLSPIMEVIKRMPGTIGVEVELAVDMHLNPVPYKASDAYVRGKLDLVKINDTSALIADYKTGKIRDDFYQLRLSTALLMANQQQVDSVLAMYLWGQFGKYTKENYNKLQAQNFWNEVITDTIRIQQAVAKNEFPTRQSGLCGWCHLYTCQFNTNVNNR